MKVILTKDVERLGKKGSVLEVKDGFARNYLLPKGAALQATGRNLQLLKIKEDKESRLRNQQKKATQGLAEQIARLSLTLPCQAKDNEELFGSVSAQMIASLLKEEGYEIDKEKIAIPEPIKKLGIYSIKLKLLPEVETEFKLWVVKK